MDEKPERDLLDEYNKSQAKNRDDWHAARRQGIGASDAPVVMRLSPWKTPLQLYYEKRGEATKELAEPNEAMEWGLLLEEVIARVYAARTGNRVRRVNKILRDEKYPFVIANLDRVIVGKPVGVEIKTTRSDEEWGEEGTDEVPEHVITQCQHQMRVANLIEVDIPVLIAGNNLRVYRVKRNESFIASIVRAEMEFWDMVKAGQPPAPVSEADARLRWRSAQPGSEVQATPEIAQYVVDLINLQYGTKQAEAQAEALKFRIMRFMEENDTLVWDGKRILTWKEQEQRRVDVVRLREAHPELVDEFTAVLPMRVMRTAPPKKAKS
jgi:putative phage-type endonuclease